MSVDLSSMLELMAGGDMDAALDRLAGDGDPMVSRVVAMMRQQRAQAAEDPALEVQARVVPGDADERRALEAQLAEAQWELEALRLRNRRLAYALGACECFGERPDCEACAGGGASGAYRVHTRLFRVLVAPAVEQAQGPGSPSFLPKKEENP